MGIPFFQLTFHLLVSYNLYMTFEEDMKALEEIVTRLERGDVPLEESLKLYQKGKQMAKFLEERLSEAEEKVKEMVKTEEGFEVKQMDIEE